jgi:UDP-GlcNAc:undecaprenyl-phosphate GlcNAc-1-phosphate transferase
MTLVQFIQFASAGFIGAVLLLLMCRKLAIRAGLTDQPGGRKNHDGAIPLIGGLVIFPVFSILVLLSGFQNSLPFHELLAAALVLLIMGVMDDRFHIMPWIRFILQIWVATFVVVVCDAKLTNLGNLFGFGDADLAWGDEVFSITCLVLLMNAINMLDGVDGLVGSFMVAALGWLAFAFFQAGALTSFYAVLFLVMPIFGFLVFNGRYPFHHKASVFLGDAGSLSLALLLGYFAITAAKEVGEAQILSPVSIIWIMTLPIVDTFAVFFVRVKQGRSPFDADRLHAHYKLIDAGITPGKTTMILFFFSVITGAIGYYAPLYGVPEYVLLYSWSVIWLGYTYYRLKNA